MIQQTYVVAWRNLDTGKTGAGKKEMTQAECELLCKSLNEAYPTFEHTPADASGAVKPTFKSEPIVLPTILALTDSDPMPFGEHKGKRMAQVPSDYLDFIQGNKGLMGAWPQVDAYISRNRSSIDQDLLRESY